MQDLHYGDVLFHFWADQDAGLEALTRLEAYNHWQRMPHHAVDAQLLAAGLYLQLTMHNEAGARFADRLLGDRRATLRACVTAPGSIWRRSGTSAAITTSSEQQALNRIQERLSAAAGRPSARICWSMY